MASQNGHTSVVDVLLRHGADPNLASRVSIVEMVYVLDTPCFMVYTLVSSVCECLLHCLVYVQGFILGVWGQFVLSSWKAICLHLKV